MPRSLSISRVTVPADKQAEYLATVRQLAELLERRGQHLWVFKSARTPNTFVEFTESKSAMSHRARSSRTQDELRLETRLQGLAVYAADAWELWEEVVTEEPVEREPWDNGGEE